MIIIGILSLLSVGLLVGSMGGDDPFSEPDNETENETPTPLEEEEIEVIDSGTPEDETPTEPEEEAQEEGIGAPPPTGEGFSDPLIISDQLAIERLEAEAAALLASAPEGLVSVTNGAGAEIPDEQVLRDGPTQGEDADRDYIVDAPNSENSIDITYNPNTTFRIDLSDAVETVTVGLNSDIDGAAGSISSVTEEIENSDGSTEEEITRTQNFSGAANITYSVSESHIGTHVAQIDLSNPDDTLHFEFSNDVGGNLHLVTHEEDQSGLDDSITQRTMYIVETAPDVRLISQQDIARMRVNDGDEDSPTRLIAEIFLGEDLVQNVPGQTILSNFINDTPQLTSNVEWTSQGEHTGNINEPSADDEEDMALPLTPGAGSGSDTGTDDPADTNSELLSALAGTGLFTTTDMASLALLTNAELQALADLLGL